MTIQELEYKWKECLSIISDNIPESAYRMWFANISPLKFENNTLWIAIPSQFVYEYIEEHYIDLLYATIGRVFGQETDLMYSVLTDKANNLVVEQASENKHSSTTKQQGDALKSTNKGPTALDAVVEDLNPMLRPNYSFENFIEGESNKLPRAAGESVSKNPERNIFNPLFLYGTSGVGKTHLLNAIGLRVKEIYPKKRVLYVSAHLFKVQYMDAVRKNTLTDFINFYQTIDVLLIDDIQEFVGAEKTQNTFFHIFNHLHQNGKQLVMSCDRMPASLQGIEDRLITRFKWGLVAEIERPNLALRRAILSSKVRHDGLSVSDDVLDYIAENVTDSIRELEGSLNSIIAHATVFNREPDVALAERIINQAIKRTPREVTIDMIIKSVCDNYHVTNEELSSTSRKRTIVLARQVAMYLSHKHIKNITYARIGEYIGKKDHTTVLHSCTQVIQQMDYDKKLSSAISAIEKEILSR